MWITRSKFGQLVVFVDKPEREEFNFSGRRGLVLDPDDFPNVTWENSPKEIKGLSGNPEKSHSLINLDLKCLLAIEALQGLLSSGNPDDGSYVNQAVGYADLLISKLKDNG